MKALTSKLLSIAMALNPVQNNRRGIKTYRKKTGSKYTPHQGKQECARRLRRGSPAWHSGK